MLHVQGYGIDFVLSNIGNNTTNSSVSLDLIHATMLKA